MTAPLFYIVANWPQSDRHMPSLALLDVIQMMRSLYLAELSGPEIAALLDELDAHSFAKLDAETFAWTERN